MPKFITKRPCHTGGDYVHASPEFPAVVEIPEGAKPPPDFEPYTDDAPVVGEKLVPPFNPVGTRAPPSAAQAAVAPKDGRVKR